MIQNDQFPMLSKWIATLIIIGKVIIVLGVIIGVSCILVAVYTEDVIAGVIGGGLICLSILLIAVGFLLSAKELSRRFEHKGSMDSEDTNG